MTTRPVHHDAWHRIADLKPRLRATLNITRQRYRGQRWHVIEDPAANQYFRLSDAAHAFVGLLDGRRTTSQALELATQRLHDAAPTPAEATRLLAELFTANLLAGDIPTDAADAFLNLKRRRAREIRGKLASFLFVKIPLVDPNRFLDAWAPLARHAYSPPALLAWLILIIAALTQLAGAIPELRNQTAGVLAPSNLPLIAITFIIVKLIHELGHGFACKAMAHAEHPDTVPHPGAATQHQRPNPAGQVHQLGIMLLALFPFPYVDTSSAWTIRSKWRRALVNAAGMHAELAVAAIAAIVFANTTTGSTANALAHNTIFIAGVSTVLFNANPLLRYDAYYILADLTETPNLASRSNNAAITLIKRALLGVRTAHDTAASNAERATLIAYALASTAYRIAVFAFIIWFVSGQLFVVGLILAAAAATLFIATPLTRATRYLTTSPELDRTRPRAIAASLATLAVPLAAAAFIPIPDTTTIPGVVLPTQERPINAAATGFAEHIAPHDTILEPGDTALVIANPELTTRIAVLAASLDAERTRRRIALRDDDPTTAAVARQRITALEDALADARRTADRLTVRAAETALWLAPDHQHLRGSLVERGQSIGKLVHPSAKRIAAVASQTAGPDLAQRAATTPTIAPAARPTRTSPATITSTASAASRQLPSPTLTFNAGGPIRPATTSSPAAPAAAEPVFRLDLAPADDAQLFLGERVWIRIPHRPAPLLTQASRAVQQLLQRREAQQ